MAKPIKKVLHTGPVSVVFSHLDSLDTEFDRQGIHSLTVSVNGKFRAILKKIQTELGSDRKLSGNKTSEEYGEQQTFKTTLHRDQTAFPEVWDHKRRKITNTPEYGDEVNVRFTAAQTEATGTKYISMYLNSVQIIESNGGNECPFDEVVVETDDELEKILKGD